MKERPILFSADIVRALLAGRKTQTRRPITTLYGHREFVLPFERRIVPTQELIKFALERGESPASLHKYCPLGQPGDWLWVRETWDFVPWDDNKGENRTVIVCYAADGDQSRPIGVPDNWHPMLYNYQRWRPSIHMPRWASRLTLEVTRVRAMPLCASKPPSARLGRIARKMPRSAMWMRLPEFFTR